MVQINTESASKVRGVVKGPWGMVSGATVAAGERSATSDSAGAYEISALTPGVYDVTVKPPFPGYEASPQKADLAAGETKVVDIYLDFEKTAVEGHVYDQDGKPIAGATLSGLLSGKDMATTTTDESGYFRVERVTPGDRFVRVNAPGYMGETRDFKVSKDEATALEFHLKPSTCGIHGTVTDENGQGLQAEIRLLKSGTVLQNIRSNETGHYEFHLAPGTYQVLATAPSYDVEPWEGSISGDTEANFRLRPSWNLHDPWRGMR